MHRAPPHVTLSILARVAGTITLPSAAALLARVAGTITLPSAAALLVGVACTITLPSAAALADRPQATGAQEHNLVDRMIRDGELPRSKAQEGVRRSLDRVRKQALEQGCPQASPKEYVFPVAGYGPRSIGGKRGSGYRPKGYRYLDGNRHKGHPSHDIFIRDRNYDRLDDRTGTPVKVLSVAGGLVVSRNTEWEAGSPIRGGKYVWVYDARTDALFYYAHLRRVLVDLGQCVAPGTPIGEVGRTGKNAAPRRSPTHLHFTHLAIVDGLPQPKDLYRHLVKARRRGPDAESATSGRSAQRRSKTP